jgi:hypothetical protein
MDRGIRYDLSGRRIRLWRREGRSSVSVRYRYPVMRPEAAARTLRGG